MSTRMQTVIQDNFFMVFDGFSSSPQAVSPMIGVEA